MKATPSCNATVTAITLCNHCLTIALVITPCSGIADSIYGTANYRFNCLHIVFCYRYQ
jgi:hypothetical protein